MQNPALVLGSAKQNLSVVAKLMSEDRTKSYQVFDWNPVSMGTSRSATYAEGKTAIRSIQSQMYTGASGRKITIPGLYIDAYKQGKTLTPVFNILESLLVADPTNNIYSAPVIRFEWGSYISPPCVMTELSWNATAWVGGEPAIATFDISLLEVPPLELPPTEASQKAKPADAAPQQLTPRQQGVANTEAGKWLAQNIRLLPDNVRQSYRRKRYNLSTGTTGTVAFEVGGSPLGTIGRYDGSKFTGGFQKNA